MKIFQNLKSHIKEHKREYIIGASCLAVGGIATYVVISRVTIDSSIDIVGDNNTVVNITQTILARRGHPGNVIRCVETGEVFASQNRAADLLGIAKSRLSSHLSNGSPLPGGLHFEKIGEAQ